jgi:ubiquitin carboxyl-terminal hydrolase 16
MPDKQLTIATYAAGASLAAVTLVYVFAPTFFIDGESANSASSRKKGVVGLINSANDCFINSVLQALAGLGDLRLYLIRETHRRKLDDPEVYAHAVPDPARQSLSAWKIQGEQEGIVTHGLKDILDALNERPLYKKTISPTGFISCLELAFKQRVSRQQQDAQEFLQILAERLCDEYHAGHRARNHARKCLNGTAVNRPLDARSVGQSLEYLALKAAGQSQKDPTITELEAPLQDATVSISIKRTDGQDGQNGIDRTYDDEEGFPFEGGSESQIECLTCGFKPKPTKSTFCVLTLSVPQVNSTTLGSCFDQMFKTEYIEGFKCEKCRLVHALDSYRQELARSSSEKFKKMAKNAIQKLETAIETNPEEELKDVQLPDTKLAPKRKIAKHVRITKFPKIMAIHLSRSIFEERLSIKNSAKVSFPERLPLGGLLDQRMYKLLSLVCHKGSHHAGHYESFRRQNLYPPFSTPNTFQASGIYSKPSTPNASQISTPLQPGLDDATVDSTTLPSTPELLSPSSPPSRASSSSLPLPNGQRSGESSQVINGASSSVGTSASISSSSTAKPASPASTSRETDTDTGSIRSAARSARVSLSSRISASRLRSAPDMPSISHPYQARPLTNNTSARETTSKASMSDIARVKKRKSPNNRWWRISDEKIKESKTGDVLGMQKEVYLLFYELETGDDDV